MALNFDDRVLGDKVENYASSSSSESEGENGATGTTTATETIPPTLAAEIAGSARAIRTGPKGVIEDYHEYRRQEKEQRIEQQANFYARLKATAMTVKTDREDEEERRKNEQEVDEEDDEFLKEYRMRRMREMYRAQQAAMPRFGALITLNADNFVAEIDKESPQTMVVVHVYEPDIPACDAMNGCLIVLASNHPTVKFCRIRASSVKMSAKFLKNGLPTLLVYQDKQLVSNFVSISRYLGSDFFAKDVENFFQEHGLLCEKEPSKLLGSPTVPKPPRHESVEKQASSSEDNE